MRVWNLVRYALISCAAGALLEGCGGSQPPINASDAMPQTSAIASVRTVAHRPSSSYQQLYRFHPRREGMLPIAGLLDVNGTLYGTTTDGGEGHHGTVYSISTSGVHKLLYRFHGGADGTDPQSDLIDVNGTLYGTTPYGGSGCSYRRGCGTVYSVSTSGTEKVLYAFKSGYDGAYPLSGLINVNGTLYGTTSQGGGFGCGSRSTVGCGTVFSVTTSGQETVLYRFAGRSDGANPNADLIDVNGVLYGTTPWGGSGAVGTVYSITPKGAEKVIYAFQGRPDGAYPVGLINVNGTLYGTTLYGGGINYCYLSGGCGVVYSLSTSGSEKVLYNFKGGPDGEFPQAPMIEMDGLLYGTSGNGGGGSPCFGLTDGCGTVFSITTAGVEAVLYSFHGGKDGGLPTGLADVNGTLYGATYFGGDHDFRNHYGHGTVFALTP